MAWRSSGTSHAELIENLSRNGLIADPRIKAAFLSVDRAHYARRLPYQDSPQSIGYDATISAPHMHAIAAKHLLPFVVPDAAKGRPAPRVLDVGSGSGYLTHVLAELVGDQGGTVVGVEHIEPLCALARANMAKSESGRQFLESGRVKFVCADGRRGAPGGDAAPFDAIHVGASAAELHQALLDQLKAPGRIFIPMDDIEDDYGSGQQYAWTIDKAADGTITRNKLFGVRYVPLTDAPRV